MVAGKATAAQEYYRPAMSLARAFSALTGASVVSMAAQLVRGKLAALLLGPAGVGVFNQLSLAFNLFSVAGGLGSNNGIIQHGAEAMAAGDDAALRRLVSTSTLLLGAIACLLAAAGVIAAPWLSDLLLDDGGRHAYLVRLVLLAVPIGVSGSVYRALLSASRAVGELVRAQIISDVGGAIVFVALIFPLGLAGAILGFMATHLLFLVLGLAYARRSLGPGVLRPRVSQFSWAVVRGNVGFGASGLVMIALSNLSVLFVSRLVIDQLGLDASGIFSNAWRIASVYLGAVTATAISYYLPTITRCETAEDMGREVNATLRFYLYALPLVMAGIMALGEPLVWLILSDQFLPAAPLLLIFVPAELVRILAETTSMPLLARKRVRLFTLNYLVTSAVFVGVAYLLLPGFGLAGAALAYGIANVAYLALALLLARKQLDLGLEPETYLAQAAALLLLAAVSAVCFALPLGLARLALVAAGCGLWLAYALRNRSLNQLFRRPHA